MVDDSILTGIIQENLQFTNFTFDNIIYTNGIQVPFIDYTSIRSGSFNANNMVFKNSYFSNADGIIAFKNLQNEVILNNIEFENITVSDYTSFLWFTGFSNLEVASLSFKS